MGQERTSGREQSSEPVPMPEDRLQGAGLLIKFADKPSATMKVRENCIGNAAIRRRFSWRSPCRGRNQRESTGFSRCSFHWESEAYHTFSGPQHALRAKLNRSCDPPPIGPPNPFLSIGRRSIP
jgi:hypothetical protein